MLSETDNQSPLEWACQGWANILACMSAQDDWTKEKSRPTSEHTYKKDNPDELYQGMMSPAVKLHLHHTYRVERPYLTAPMLDSCNRAVCVILSHYDLDARQSVVRYKCFHLGAEVIEVHTLSMPPLFARLISCTVWEPGATHVDHGYPVSPTVRAKTKVRSNSPRRMRATIETTEQGQSVLHVRIKPGIDVANLHVSLHDMVDTSLCRCEHVTFELNDASTHEDTVTCIWIHPLVREKRYQTLIWICLYCFPTTTAVPCISAHHPGCKE